MKNELNLTAEQAETLYIQLYPEAGILSDTELGKAAGGALFSRTAGKLLDI